MARLKLSLPETFSFSTTLPVRITDLNYGGHVGNDTILTLLHEARVHYLQHMGFSELDLAGVSLIMADVAIEYKGEGFYGDILSLRMAFADVHKYGFDITYHVLNQHGKEIARAKTGMLCFNYQERKLMALPDEVKAQIETNA